MGLTLFTAPTDEPINVEEAKLFAKIHGAADDTLVKALIKAVRIAGEAKSDRAFVTQTWDFFLDGFPEWELRVPKPPLQSVTWVKYYAPGESTLTTLSASDYLVSTAREPGIITPAVDEEWPATEDRVDAVQIRFVAGYGAPAAVPEDIRTMIKVGVLWRETNRASLEDVGRLFEQFWHGCYDLER